MLVQQALETLSGSEKAVRRGMLSESISEEISLNFSEQDAPFLILDDLPEASAIELTERNDGARVATLLSSARVVRTRWCRLHSLMPGW